MGASCTVHDKRFCSKCDMNWFDELAFVQRFEVIDKRSLLIDNIDKVFHCLRLRWQRTCGYAGLLLFAAGYELIPLKMIRAYAYLVKNNFGVDLLSEYRPTKIEI